MEPLDERLQDALKSPQAMSRIMPALEGAATTPELFSKEERLAIIKFLMAALSLDTKTFVQIGEIAIALEAENQRRGQQIWPTSVPISSNNFQC